MRATAAPSSRAASISWFAKPPVCRRLIRVVVVVTHCGGGTGVSLMRWLHDSHGRDARPTALAPPRARRMIGHFLVCLVEFDAHDLAHALLLHGHSVKDIGHANGAFVVGDNDELRMR